MVIFVGLVSCEKQPEPVYSQRAKIEALFTQRGFILTPSSPGPNARQGEADNNVKIKTVAEAKAFLQTIETLVNQQKNREVAKKDKRGRLALYACDDSGMYYIDQAIGNAVTSVNVHYERIGPDGHIGNIFTDLTGWGVIGWDQVKTTVYNPKSEFCIDGIMTFGIDIEGLPLNMKSAVSLRIKLNAGDCGVMVTSRFGRCGE